jgi:allantoin racemase
MRIKLILTFPLDAAGIERRRARIPTGLLRPDTTVDLVPIVDAGKLLMDSHYDFAFFEPFVIAQGIQAEDEGYDGIAVDTVSDMGVNALRSRLRIPVIGPGQTAYAVASMLGRRFSILTRWDNWKWLHDASLDAYGLRSQCASIRAPKLPDEVVAALPSEHAGEAGALIEGHPDYFPAFLREADAAIHNDGADVLILASMTMQEAHEYLRTRVDVPVIDPGLLALAMLELWISLGLTHSKATWSSPSKILDQRFLGMLEPQPSGDPATG